MLLYYAMVTLHVIVCVILILVVLLQSGKGADLAGAFGGGATQTAFGSRGPASFLSKMTAAAAVIFMLTSIGLATISTDDKEEKSVLDATQQKASEPARQAPAPAGTPAATPTPEQIRQKVEELQKRQQQAPAQQQPDSKPAESNQPAR